MQCPGIAYWHSTSDPAIDVRYWHSPTRSTLFAVLRWRMEYDVCGTGPTEEAFSACKKYRICRVEPAYGNAICAVLSKRMFPEEMFAAYRKASVLIDLWLPGAETVTAEVPDVRG
eukprot:3518851-Rhodomonas_salina.2